MLIYYPFPLLPAYPGPTRAQAMERALFALPARCGSACTGPARAPTIESSCQDPPPRTYSQVSPGALAFQRLKDEIHQPGHRPTDGVSSGSLAFQRLKVNAAVPQRVKRVHVSSGSLASQRLKAAPVGVKGGELAIGCQAFSRVLAIERNKRRHT
jgi:hypothetical protein